MSTYVDSGIILLLNFRLSPLFLYTVSNQKPDDGEDLE